MTTHRKHISTNKTRNIRYHAVKRISNAMFKKLDELSPFELNYKLIGMAGLDALNAGRGNPNFYNSFGRQVFIDIQNASIALSNSLATDIKIYPNESDMNYKEALLLQAKSWPKDRRDFLKDYINFLTKHSKKQKIDSNSIIYDVVKSSLGCYYPVPPQIQPHLSVVAQHFLYELATDSATGNEPGYKMSESDFECFATEGAAAGILYVFNTMKENYLLLPKDKIAIITPIFSPYLEMPSLSDYDLKIVELKCNPNKNYSLDDNEIDKLKDKKIKALFVVNPANPSGFSLSKENIERIGHIVNTERKDLIILADNVYAPFADQYNSLMLSCPYNTIEVYSLSKYFGTTGWRLGLCMISKKNRLNKLIANLPLKYKNALHKRYSTATLTPEKLTFMNRLVFDSRQVAEAHVGGLSTPQQVLMGILLYYDIRDRDTGGEKYRRELKTLLKNRISSLYDQLKTPLQIAPTQTNYYNLIDIHLVTKNIYGEKAANYLVKEYSHLEFLFHLVGRYKTILLPGAGFGTSPWIFRICLANLKSDDYPVIGKKIRDALRDLVTPVLI